MSGKVELEQTTFTAMRQASREDYQTIGRHSLALFEDLPRRVLAHLELLVGDTGGYAVDRLTHSLQTASRAQRDGRDDEYVVCALLHDIGDTLACTNHAQLAATILGRRRDAREESCESCCTSRKPFAEFGAA